MTPASVGWGLVIGLVLPLVIGMSCRRAKLSAPIGSAWALAGGLALAMALLLAGSSHDYWRSLSPREALDWLPGLAVVLAAIESVRSGNRVHMLAKWIGLAVCVCIAFRLLYGSVYLRPGNLNPLALGILTLWGLAMAVSWAALTRVDEPDDGRTPWVALLLLTSLLGLTALASGLSGSLTYGCVGGIIALATLTSGISTGRIPAASGPLALCMTGLSQAFSELPLPAAVAIEISVLTFILGIQVVDKRFRWLIMLLSTLLMLASCGIVARQFVAKLSAKPEINGYEAYK